MEHMEHNEPAGTLKRQRQPRRSGGRGFTIAAFVIVLASLFVVHPFVAVVGVVLGIVGHVKGDGLGKWAAGASALVIVLAIAMALLASNGG